MTASSSAVTNLSKPGCPVVGIGASAGGLDAYKKFFTAMPVDSGMAFVLIPHLDPKHESLMVELLSRQTAMPVVEAKEGTPVEINRVYIIPPNKYLTISGGALQLSPPPQPQGGQTAIDFFLRSLAADQGERAIGIVLSGTGSHGTSGLREIKLAGGMVMAQEIETAEYDQMPRSAIGAGIVDCVLPPEQMPEALVKYIQHPYLNHADKTSPHSEHAAEQLTNVLAMLRSRTKYDFCSYRKNMLMRRVQRRMGLRHVEQFSAYVDLLRNDANEVTALYKDLLIGVTAFFREPEAFSLLAQKIIPEMIDRGSDERPIRVWTPGCATGEEAYTIAMLLMEGFAEANKAFNIQVFASDIDDQSLEIARSGIYPASIASDVSSERLKRFFVKTDESHYQVNKQVRESIVFATQNLISDAPFSRLDLITCRNLLIYLEPDVQQKVIALFHFALNEDGYLLLGPSESIGRAVDMFDAVSKKWRVYRRMGQVRRELVDIPIIATQERRGVSPRALPALAPPKGFRDLTEKLILSDYAPAAALINRRYEILYVTGPLVNYLEFPSGELTKDLLAMTRQGLRTKVRAACHLATREGRIVTDAEARVKRDSNYAPCTITVRPITEPKEAEGLMLITFQDRSVGLPYKQGADNPALANRAVADEESKLVQQLEVELKSTREDLQSTIEEFETSNEELKASNEEIMSMNEELQSSNEELETSKEELQSLYEELSTVNNQLQDKVNELDKANNDLTNLMAASDIATVFLDSNLRIVRFTPPTTKLLNLMGTDVGRPFRDFAPRFTNDNLLTECERVLDKLAPVERELRTEDRHYYLRRILPYRTADNRIEGVAITYVEITARVQAEADSRRLATALRNSNDAVTVQSLDGQILVWNRGAEQMYGYTQAEALRMNARDFVPEHLRDKALTTAELLAAGKDSASIDTKRLTKDGRTLDVLLTASKLVDKAGEVYAIATTERDVTERTHQSRLLAEAVSHLGEGVMITSDDLDWTGPLIVFANEAMSEITGYSSEELIGQSPRLLQGDGTDPGTLSRISGELAADRSCVAELTHYHKDGTPYESELFISPLFSADGRRTNFVSIHRDITEQKRAREALRASEEQFRTVLNTAADAIITIDLRGIITGVNPATEQMFGYSREELLGHNIKMLMPSPFAEEHDGYIARYLETGEARIIGIGREVVGRRRNGTTFSVDLAVNRVNHLGQFTGVIRDISERKKLQRDVVAAAEEQQQRIGQELHDSTQQELAGLGMLAQTLLENLSKESNDALKAHSNLASRIVDGIARVHEQVQTVSRGLMPVRLAPDGLMDALRELVARTDELDGVTCAFKCENAVEIADGLTATHLFRIAQESIANALKHAKAEHILVALESEDGRPILQIADDGIGFDAAEPSDGLGLKSMSYRASLIGANLTVTPVDSGGTLVTCRVFRGGGIDHDV